MSARTWVVAVVAAFAICGPLAAIASGHAAYRGSDPADESTVSQPPSQVWAEFTEPVVADSRLEVYDPCGVQVDARNSTVTGYRITIGMSGSAQGAYTVRFEVVSAVDGHPTNGAFTFTSTGGEDCAGTSEQPSEPEGPDEQPDPRGGPDRKEPRKVSTETDPGPGDPAGSEREVDRREERSPARRSDPRAPRSRREPTDVAEVAAPLETQAEPGALSDLPIDGLIVGLVVSAVIGAAGGVIYAGIMGPRD